MTLPLFDCEPVAASAPFQGHSATSREAAERIVPDLGRLRAEVLAYLHTRGALGATDDEMQVALAMNPSTQRPRRIELVARGLVQSHPSLKRPTRTGRSAVVWVVA